MNNAVTSIGGGNRFEVGGGGSRCVHLSSKYYVVLVG